MFQHPDSLKAVTERTGVERARLGSLLFSHCLSLDFFLDGVTVFVSEIVVFANMLSYVLEDMSSSLLG